MSTFRYPQALAGFTSCMMGYRVTQIGLHGSVGLEQRLEAFRQNRSDFVLKYGLISVGMMVFSYGFVLGMDAGLSPELALPQLANMGYSGLIIVTGFMMAHKGLNGVML